MKCLDKKRIKMKQGETLALNERIMLSLVSTGVSWEAKRAPVVTSDPSLSWSLLTFPSLLGLPLHRVHVICIPHTRQAQFHPGSHEW